jgi:maleylpyruvate isomerase
VDASLAELVVQLDEATAALLRTADNLTDDDVRQPSLLPGWTCERVLIHLAQNGPILGDLLQGRPVTLPGEPVEGRTAAELAADLRASAAAFRELVLSLPEDGWDRPVELPGGKLVPARELLVRRLVEIELHHVDLGSAYRPEDWPTTFNKLELADPMRQWRADRL